MFPTIRRWPAPALSIFDHASFPSIDRIPIREVNRDASFGRYLLDEPPYEGSIESIEKQFWRHVAKKAAAGQSFRVTAFDEDVCIVTPHGVYPPGTKFSGDPK